MALFYICSRLRKKLKHEVCFIYFIFFFYSARVPMVFRGYCSKLIQNGSVILCLMLQIVFNESIVFAVFIQFVNI